MTIMRKQAGRLAAIVSAGVLAVVFSTAANAQITVTSATPNNVPQDTTGLNVAIAGSGFQRGAKASWYVTSTTETGMVVVNSTTFVNSGQLVANITIPYTATVSGYDVVVANTSGRTGVGSHAFTVNPEAVTSPDESVNLGKGVLDFASPGIAAGVCGRKWPWISFPGGNATLLRHFVKAVPGFYFGKDGKPAPISVLRKRFQRIAFGHSELNGTTQAWETAAAEGKRALTQALEVM